MKKWLPVIVVGLAVAVIVTIFSPLASSHPDGLERVAENNGFIQEAKGPSYEIIPDYVFPGVENEKIATILSGLVGVALVAAIGFGLAYLIKTMSRGGRSSSPPGS